MGSQRVGHDGSNLARMDALQHFRQILTAEPPGKPLSFPLVALKKQKIVDHLYLIFLKLST